MIAELAAYPDYRLDGPVWCSRIPSHWDTVRNGRLFQERNQTGFTELPVLEVSLRTGVRVRNIASGARKQVMSDYARYKRASQNDIAYNMMRMWQGAIGVVPCDGLVSPAYVVAKPLQAACCRYFCHLFRTADYMFQIDAFSRGIVKDRNRLYWDAFKQMPSLVPPPDEQELIVRFLDWASVRLGKAIAAKRKVIGLLEEQKQAIIHRAVTCGLDDTVPLKASDLDWLGDVPAHWKVMRIKNLLSGIDYGTSENARGEGHIRVLNMGHIKSGRVSIPAKGSLRAMPQGLELRSHDLLFNRTNSPELVGKVGIFLGTEADQVTFASYLVRLRPKTDHNPFWLNYVLNSNGFWHYARRQAFVSLHQANLNSTRYSQMSIPVPPASEQQLIAESLRAETESFDNAISANEHEIELIREYRTRLIADVVTGKLDVREFARTLPADISEEAAELASSELGDDEFSDSDDEVADELAGEPI